MFRPPRFRRWPLIFLKLIFIRIPRTIIDWLSCLSSSSSSPTSFSSTSWSSPSRTSSALHNRVKGVRCRSASCLHRLPLFLFRRGRSSSSSSSSSLSSSSAVRALFFFIIVVVFVVNVVFFPWIFMGKIPAPTSHIRGHGGGGSGGGGGGRVDIEESWRSNMAERKRRFESGLIYSN